MQLGSTPTHFSVFPFCGGAAMWQPWSTRPGCVEANVVYLRPGQALPPLQVNGHFQFPATATLADVAADVATTGCQRCATEALAIFARPLQYGPDGPGPSADPDEPNDSDSNLTDVTLCSRRLKGHLLMWSSPT